MLARVDDACRAGATSAVPNCCRGERDVPRHWRSGYAAVDELGELFEGGLESSEVRFFFDAETGYDVPSDARGAGEAAKGAGKSAEAFLGVSKTHDLCAGSDSDMIGLCHAQCTHVLFDEAETHGEADGPNGSEQGTSFADPLDGGELDNEWHEDGSSFCTFHVIVIPFSGEGKVLYL